MAAAIPAILSLGVAAYSVKESREQAKEASKRQKEMIARQEKALREQESRERHLREQEDARRRRFLQTLAGGGFGGSSRETLLTGPLGLGVSTGSSNARPTLLGA